RISLELFNADLALNSIFTPENVQGAEVVARFVFVDPDTGNPTSDSKVFGKFIADLPEDTYPTVRFTCNSKWNLDRRVLPLRVITRKDPNPFPSTAAERALAGSDPASDFYRVGYDPDNSKGSYAVGNTAAAGGTNGTTVKASGTTW